MALLHLFILVVAVQAWLVPGLIPMVALRKHKLATTLLLTVVMVAPVLKLRRNYSSAHNSNFLGAKLSPLYLQLENTMKVIFAFFVLILITSCSFGQKRTVICGKVKFDKKFIAHIFDPINNYYVSFNVDATAPNSVLVNGKDSIYKEIKIDRPTFINVLFETENKNFINRTDVLVFPGDSLNLNFDLSIGNSNWVRYGGANAAGQKLFNEINYYPGAKFGPFFEILNRLPENRMTVIKEIDDYISETKNRFVALKPNGKISQRFIDTLAICFKAIFYGELINKLINNYKQRDAISKEQRDSILQTVAALLPANNPKLFGLYNYNIYLEMYYDYLTYKKYNLHYIEEINEKNQFTFNGHKYIVDENLAPIAYIEDETMRRDIWAFQLLTFLKLFPGAQDKNTIDQYCEIFPGNKWEKFLRLQLADNPAPKKIEYKLQSSVTYVDPPKTPSSLNSLLKQLPPGKAVFIDCWATWCSPCVQAFGYNKQVDSLLLANQVDRLYISIDNPDNRASWKNAVEKYCLGGFHILASKELIADIERLCKLNPKEGFQIPRYMFVDKKGMLFTDDVPTPENFDLLKKKIESSAGKNN